MSDTPKAPAAQKSNNNVEMVESILEWVRTHTLKDNRIIPVCIWSERGQGKTQMIRNFCEQRKFGFRGYHPTHDSEGTDIVGLTYRDEDIQRTMHARPMWLPAKNDVIEWNKDGIIFIDEINRADKKVMNALLEPLGEGTLEKSNWELPDGWQFVLAANPPLPGYDVNRMDDAMMNRMVHVPLDFDVISWASWAESSDLPRELISFTARFPDMFETNQSEDLFEVIEPTATPRTMEYLARLYEPGMNRDMLEIIACGLIGPTAGRAFISHLSAADKPVSAEEILTGNFQEKLKAHVEAGRTDLLQASQVLLLSYLAKFSTKDAEMSFQHIVLYIQMLGADMGSQFLVSMQKYAPEWHASISVFFSKK